MKLKILNLGCGNDDYGTHRVDVVKTETSTHVSNITKEKLPFQDNFFDIVYSRNFFEHMPNPLNALLEMKRVCKMGGVIEIITDNAEYYIFHIGRDRKNPFKLKTPHGASINYSSYGNVSTNNDDCHYGIYTIEHMQNFLNLAGLEIRDVWVDNFDKPSKLTHVMIFLGNLINPRGRFKPKLKAIAIKR